MRKSKKFFTLLELFVCIMLLGTLSTVLMIQIKGFLSRHQYENSLKGFYSRLQQFKILAASYDCDIKLVIYKEKDALYYKFQPDQPLAIPDSGKAFALKGVESLKVGEKRAEPFVFTIYPSFRMDPKEPLQFFQNSSEASCD